MIPKLYSQYESNGYVNQSYFLANLADTISCVITEELNGMYELELEYPTNSKYFDALMTYDVLSVEHPYRNQTYTYMERKEQTFVINKRAIENEVLTVYANHVSYAYGNEYIVTPINRNVQSVGQIVSVLGVSASGAMDTGGVPFICDAIKSKREYLMDGEYSLASVYGCEYRFDQLHAYYFAHRGGDFGVELRVGKNITSASAERDSTDSFNAIAPFWERDGVRVVYTSSTLPVTHTVQPTVPISPIKEVAMDFTEMYDTAPTSAQLEAAARNYLDTNEPWHPKETADVGFYPLWEALTFTNADRLEGVGLGDEVTVYWSEGGLDGVKLRAVKTTYDVIRNMFTEIQLGTLERGYVVTSDGGFATITASGTGGGARSAIYLTNVACSAMTGDFASASDNAITADYVLAEIVFANPSAISSDVTWTTAAGSLTLNGTCSAATTCNIVLV